jgi:hypothetical protein
MARRVQRAAGNERHGGRRRGNVTGKYKHRRGAGLQAAAGHPLLHRQAQRLLQHGVTPSAKWSGPAVENCR